MAKDFWTEESILEAYKAAVSKALDEAGSRGISENELARRIQKFLPREMLESEGYRRSADKVYVQKMERWFKRLRAEGVIVDDPDGEEGC